jgi:hypothetical protein
MSCEDNDASRIPQESPKEVDENRANRELERWLYYSPRWSPQVPISEASGEPILTIIYNPKKGTVGYKRITKPKNLPENKPYAR